MPGLSTQNRMKNLHSGYIRLLSRACVVSNPKILTAVMSEHDDLITEPNDRI